MKTISVKSQSGDYDVFVGAGVRREIDTFISPSARVVVVHPAAIDPDLTIRSTAKFLALELDEKSKSIQTVEDLGSQFAQLGITRNDFIVGVGGGVLTDTVGFAASIYHRGTPFIAVPTTLLGMSDASIGGKTGVNIPEGKNLLGTITPPKAVFIDTDYLKTLPAAELRSGFGEIAKYEVIARQDWSNLDLDGQIANAVALKGEIVSEDEREATGRRHVLNFGHTLGHAIEIESEFSVRHGEAVAIGVAFATNLAFELGRIDKNRRDKTFETIARYGLSVEPPLDMRKERLLDLMRRDKKSDGDLTFVLDGPGGVELVPNVSPTAVNACLNAFLETGRSL